MVLWPFEWLDALLTDRAPRSPGGVASPGSREWEVTVEGAARGERAGEPISRIVGVYQIVLRRTLEHFFPGAQFEVLGDRSIIDWDGSSDETYFRLHDDPERHGGRDRLAGDAGWRSSRETRCRCCPRSAGWSR